MNRHALAVQTAQRAEKRAAKRTIPFAAERFVRRLHAIVWLAAALLLMALDHPAGNHAQEPAANSSGDEAGLEPRAGYLVPVHVPIRDGEDSRVRRTVEQILSTARASASARRPVIVFEFQIQGDSPQGSKFGPAYELANFLASGPLARVQTVAYVPRSLVGHAVLPVIACEQIIMAPEAELGEAGRDEPVVKEAIRTAYSEVARYRNTIPVPVALGMLDRQLAVHRLEMIDGGVQYVTAEDLESLRAKASREERIIREGELGKFTGRELRLKYGFVSHLVRDRKELAEALKLAPEALEGKPTIQGEWKGIQFEVRGQMDGNRVREVLRGLRERRADVNLVCLVIDSPGGSLRDAVALADELARCDPSRVRTVAVVDDKALAVASLAALACDELILLRHARLGGPGDPDVSIEERDAVVDAIRKIGERKNRDWSLMAALIDDRVAIHRYTRAGSDAARYFSEQEHAALADPESWQRGDAVKTASGLSAAQAQQLRLTRQVVDHYDEFLRAYEIDEPLQRVERPWLVASLERLAAQQWFSHLLLFIGFFMLITEASTPGLGIAGFLSGLCFLLFFWAQFLNGNSGWLEVILFGAGFFCVLLEVFVVPGTGIFGIGGGVMIIGSIIMASQTFVLPHNVYQYEQLGRSLFTVASGIGGGMVALALMRKYLADSPIGRRLMLKPPTDDEREERSRREEIVSWTHLQGKRGVTETQLTPSGKARFGDEVVAVLSDGDLIPRGCPVVVSEVHGNRVIVQPIEPPHGG